VADGLGKKKKRRKKKPKKKIIRVKHFWEKIVKRELGGKTQPQKGGAWRDTNFLTDGENGRKIRKNGKN